MSTDIVNIGLAVDSRDVRQGKRDLNELGKQGKETKKATDGLTSSMKLMGAAIIAAGGATMWKVIDQHREFTKAISELSAITGATGKDLQFYKQQALDLGRTTTFSAQEVATAFKLVASAKPDLLNSKEALASVTREVLVLAEASGMELPEAAKALGGSLNQFGADAAEASRYINVLAAGAKLGASEITDTTQAMKNAGAVASSLGLSFEETNAAIQAMAAVSIKGAEAGTGLRGVLLKLSTQSRDEFNPEVVGLAAALKNLQEAHLTTAEKADLFGQESITAATALITQADAVAKLTKELHGTDTAYEQARINTNNLDGDMKAMSSSWSGAALTLGNIFDPALRATVQLMTDAGKAATVLASAFISITKIIAVGGALYAAYLGINALIASGVIISGSAALAAGALSAAQFLLVTALYTVVAPLQMATVAATTFGGAMASSAAATMASVKAIGLLKIALGVIFAAFAGWEIGSWMVKEFDIVKKAGIALAGGIHTTFIKLSGGIKRIGEEIGFALTNPIDFARGKIADLLEWISSLGGAALKFLGLNDLADSLPKDFQNIRGKTAEEHAATLALMTANAEKEANATRDIYAKMFADVDLAKSGGTGAGADDAAVSAEIESQQRITEIRAAAQEAAAARKQEELVADEEARLAQWEKDNEWFEAEIERDDEIYARKLEQEQAYLDSAFGQRTAMAEAAYQFTQSIQQMEYANSLKHGVAMLGSVANSSKAMFEFTKKASIASAVVSGYQAAIDAWKAGMATGGPWAPVVAVAYTAMSIARTASMISSIKSSSFGGGGSVSGGGSGGGIPSSPSVGQSTSLPSSAETPAAPPARELRVTVESDGPHSDGMRKFAENLAETMKDMGSNTNLVIS